jgi:hypothetical protein
MAERQNGGRDKGIEEDRIVKEIKTASQRLSARNKIQHYPLLWAERRNGGTAEGTKG